MIFRMGRIAGGARGPGLFFILPCTDEIRIIDQRTISFDVPPQEVRKIMRVLGSMRGWGRGLYLMVH